MANIKINRENPMSQHKEMGLNLVGPTNVYLDSDFLRINHELAKKFERLNGGGCE